MSKNDDIFETLPDIIVRRIEGYQTFVLQFLGGRIKRIGELLPSDAHRLNQLIEAERDINKINAELARITQKNTADIYAIFDKVAKEDLSFAEVYYKARRLPFIPYEQNSHIRNLTRAMARQTADTYVNLSKTTAYAIRNKKTGKLEYPDIAQQYLAAVDQAVQNISMGFEDFQTNMRTVLKEMAKTSGDNELVRQCNERIKACRGKYNEISEATGIDKEPQRMTIVKGEPSAATVDKTTVNVENYATTVSEANSVRQDKNYEQSMVDRNDETDYNELTYDEQYAVKTYISSESYKINEALRDGAPLTEYQKSVVRNLDSALDKLPKYTGPIIRVIKIDDIDGFINKYKKGEDITFEEYLSFSDKWGYDENANVFFFVENSKNARDIRHINIAESEILYERKKRFKITDIKRKGDKFYIYMEENNE